MIFFEWQDEYELGLPQIDLQHTMIVNMINELFSALGSAEADYVTRLTLDKLLDYIEEHFAAEESAMREFAYPQIDEHVALHRLLRQQVEGLHRQHHATGRVSGFELIEFLKNWFEKHIVVTDKAFGAHVARCNEAARKAHDHGAD